MKNKTIKIIALLGAVFLTAFAVVFTIALAVDFKEPFNVLSLLLLVLGIIMAAIVWYYKKREESAQELLKALTPENQEGEENENADADDNPSDENTQTQKAQDNHTETKE
ncbi:MAG TPA: hypothetical protein VIL24_05935 [Clostridia bacterium]